MLIAGIVSPSGIRSCDLENVYLNLTHTRPLGHHGWIKKVHYLEEHIFGTFITISCGVELQKDDFNGFTSKFKLLCGCYLETLLADCSLVL